MEVAAVEDIVVDTDSRAIAEIASEILMRGGWAAPIGA